MSNDFNFRQKIKTDIKRRTLISGGPSDPMLRTPLNTSIGGSSCTSNFAGITFSNAVSSSASSSASHGLGLSSSLGPVYSTAGSTQYHSANRDVKEYAASPPQLIPNSTIQQSLFFD